MTARWKNTSEVSQRLLNLQLSANIYFNLSTDVEFVYMHVLSDSSAIPDCWVGSSHVSSICCTHAEKQVRESTNERPGKGPAQLNVEVWSTPEAPLYVDRSGRPSHLTGE